VTKIDAPDERADWLAALAAASDGRFIAFADLALGDVYSPRRAADELTRAAETLGLPADDLQLVPVLRRAAELGLPVTVHSCPVFDYSAPHRIVRMAAAFPDLTWIVAHMGGVRFMDLLPSEVYVDFSGTLLGRCDLYGIEFAERFLRRLGLGRVLFATDYPIFACERYYTVLDRMQFTEDETEQIAYRNAAAILA